MAQNYNLPDDWRERLATTKKAAVTPDDKLKLLDQVRNHVGSLLGAGTNRTIFNAIERDIRAQKDSAPAPTGTPSRTEERIEQGSSIPPKALERKIVTAHGCTLLVTPRTGVVALDLDAEPLDLTPDEARQLAAVLLEAAGDVDRDAAVREHYANLVKQ